MNLKDHVIEALLDQIPDEYLWKAVQLLNQRRGCCPVYVLSWNHWCFEDAIEDSVKAKCKALDKAQKRKRPYHAVPERYEWWIAEYKALWKKRFSDPDNKADIYDYECVISDTLIGEIQDIARENFEKEGDLESLHEALLHKEYGVIKDE